jgi:FkbM family methyltransferase
VGAHAGWYTRTLSELVGPEGRVIAVEPVPPTFELLVASLKRLHLGNVTALICALSSTARAATMVVPRDDGAGLNYYTAHLSDGQGEPGSTHAYPVAVRKLDDLLSEAGLQETVGFIKIDVEGHEWPVLQGALDTVRRARPALLIEVTSAPDDPTSAAFSLRRTLEALGYAMFWFAHGNLRRWVDGHPSVNYFFLSELLRDRVAERGLLAETRA